MEVGYEDALEAISRGVDRFLERWREEVFLSVEYGVQGGFIEILTENEDLQKKFMQAIEVGASSMEFTNCQNHDKEDDE